MKKNIPLIIAFTFCLHNQSAHSFPTTDIEFLSLPPYCHARMRGSPSEKKKWGKKFPKSYIHLHHYCAGLNYKNKALVSFSKKKERYSIFKRAIHEFDYMIKNAPATFILLPELYYYKGEIYEQLGKTKLAIQSYNKSIKTNKKYTRTYGGLSDLYLKLGKESEALQTLKEGLKLNPKSKLLNRRLKKICEELGIKADIFVLFSKKLLFSFFK